MIILGIDPGSRITGYGIIQEEKGKIYYQDSGCIRTTHKDLSARLMDIFTGLSQLIEQYNPNEIAIEEIFMHQNPNAALKLGHARGAAMVAGAARNIKIYEYSARRVKQSIVGYGAAQKNQIKHMVMQLLMLNKIPQTDAADALAIAMCHSHTKNNLLMLAKEDTT